MSEPGCVTKGIIAYLEHGFGSSVDDALASLLHFVKEAHLFGGLDKGIGCIVNTWEVMGRNDVVLVVVLVVRMQWSTFLRMYSCPARESRRKEAALYAFPPRC